MSPFDIRSVVLAKHAQHVVLIHFPIALFIAGVAFDFLAARKKHSGLATAAYFNLLVSALSTLPVIATGLLAWRWQLEGARLRGNLLLHLVLGALSTFLIWMVWRACTTRRGAVRTGLFPHIDGPLELLGLLLVGLTGHLGGFLIGLNS